MKVKSILPDDIKKAMEKGFQEFKDETIDDMFVGTGFTGYDKRAFIVALDNGLNLTLTTLYEAGVNDKTIIKVVNKYWGIPNQEVEKRLTDVKSNLTLQALWAYLKKEYGKDTYMILKYCKDNNVYSKVRNKDLWSLRNSPKDLFLAVDEGK